MKSNPRTQNHECSNGASQWLKTIIISPDDISKVRDALAECCRLAQERYELSDLNENPLTIDDIQREGPEEINLAWESVREEVSAIDRMKAFEIMRVASAGLEAFENACRNSDGGSENSITPVTPSTSAMVGPV